MPIVDSPDMDEALYQVVQLGALPFLPQRLCSAKGYETRALHLVSGASLRCTLVT